MTDGIQEDASLGMLFAEWIRTGQSEGLRLDFKSGQILAPDHVKRGRITLARTAASFANTLGGRIAVGLSESGSRDPGVATTMEPAPDDWHRDRLLEVLNDLVTPPIPGLEIRVESLKSGGKLLLVEVPQSILGHQNRTDDGRDGGEYRVRQANGTGRALNGHEIRQLILRSETPVPTLTLYSAAAGARLQSDDDTLEVTWILYASSLVGIVDRFRVTMFEDGVEDETKPSGWERRQGRPTLGGDEFVSARTESAANLFAGVLMPLVSRSMPFGKDTHVFLSALLQSPGTGNSLFAWHLRFDSPPRRFRLSSPVDTWWDGIALRDATGGVMPFTRARERR